MAVAQMVGLADQKHVPKEAEDIMIGKNEEVNDMVIKYLHLSASIEILMLATYKEIAALYSKMAMSGEIGTYVKSMDLVTNAINDLQEKLLKGKDETDLRAELYITIEGKGLGLRVEDIAEKLQRGEEIFPEANPYGNYNMKKMKFVGDK
jgi:hypothetical protein